MSEDWINQVTLNCLMNKQQYEKYLSSHIKKQNNEENKKIYSSRIIELTKILFEECENNTNLVSPDVNYAFENYIKTCIHYFKIHDNNLLIQEQYKELDKLEVKEVMEIQNDSFINEFEENISEILNKESCMKRTIKICNSNLDSFINSNYAKKLSDKNLDDITNLKEE